MRNERMIAVAVGVSLLFSILAFILGIARSPENPTHPITRFGLPDDIDIKSLQVTLYDLEDESWSTQAQESKKPRRLEFVVDPEHIPKIMHCFRPQALMDHETSTSFGRHPMGTLKIDINWAFKLEVEFYEWGANPVVFTDDHQHYFVGNPWCAKDGGSNLQWVIMEAYTATKESANRQKSQSRIEKLP
jgi:hypothetical protein